MLIQAYPKGLAYHKAIFFDTEEGKYYNARTDIYLDTEDVKYYNLRPPELVNTDKPLRDDYFITWDRSDSIREAVFEAIDRVNKSIRPSSDLSQDYEIAKTKLAQEVVDICKSLCPTQIWSNQSVVSDRQD